MSTNFPAALDDDSSLYQVTDNVTAIIAAHHNNLKDAVKAVEAKIGIGNTSVATSLDYRLGHPSAGHAHSGASGQGQRISHTDLLNSPTGNPHTQYQLATYFAQASGYPPMDASKLVAASFLGFSAGASLNRILTGDRFWRVMHPTLWGFPSYLATTGAGGIMFPAADGLWRQINATVLGQSFASYAATSTLFLAADGFWRVGSGGGGGGSALTVDEVDGSPTDNAVDHITFPNDSISITGHTVTVRQVPYGFIGAKAYATSTQTINNTSAAVTMDSEEFDTDGFHDTVSNTSRLTVPAGLGGKYLVMAGTFFSASGSWVGIKKNGSNVRGFQTGTSYQQVGVIIDLVAGDYVEFWANTTGNVTVGHATLLDAQSWITAVKLDAGRVGSGIGARVRAVADVALTSGSIVYLTFDTEDFDTDGFHSTASNTERMTIPTGLGGKYLVTAASLITSAAGNGTYCVIRKNGSTIVASGVANGTDTSAAQAEIVTVLDLAAGDYLEFGIKVNASSKSAIDAGVADPSFSIMRLDSGGAAASARGTAFPSGPATNDRFFRTDRGIEYYWDGTQWLSVNEYVLAGSANTLGGATVTGTRFQWIPVGTYSIWVVRFEFSSYVAATNNGSLYWTIDLMKETPALVQTSLGNANTSADTQANMTRHNVTVGALVDPSTHPVLSVVGTKTSTPGALTVGAQAIVRLVG